MSLTTLFDFIKSPAAAPERRWSRPPFPVSKNSTLGQDEHLRGAVASDSLEKAPLPINRFRLFLATRSNVTSSRDVSRISPGLNPVPNLIPESNHGMVSESLTNVTYRRQKALHSFHRDISAEPHTLLSTERYPHSDPEDPDPEDPDLDLATCLLYTSPSPRDQRGSRMPSSA